jgi:hypothetical protein
MDTSSNINDDPKDAEDSEDQRKTKETCTSANDGTSDQLAYVETLFEPLQGEEATLDQGGKSVEVVSHKSKSSITDEEMEVEDFVKEKANSDDFSGIHTIHFGILPQHYEY